MNNEQLNHHAFPVTGKVVAAIVSLVLAFLLTVGFSYAWLTNFWDSNKVDVGFSTGTVEYPSIHMWTYLTEDEAETVADATAGWTQVVLTPEDHNAIIPDMGITQGDGYDNTEAFTIDVKKVHLGTVDNLVTMKEDNVLYFRFDVKKSMGTNFHLVILPAKPVDGAFNFSIFSLNQDGTTYTEVLEEAQDENGDKIKQTDENGDVIKDEEGNDTYVYKDVYVKLNDAINPTGDETESKILDISYASSTTALVPGGAGFSDLEFGEFKQPDGVSSLANDASYYVYVKMTPRFSTVAAISQDLYRYMPCILLFDLTIYYEIYTPREVAP